MTSELKCKCNHCSESLSFAAEGIGETITCPHCGMETVLYDSTPRSKPVASLAQPEKNTDNPELSVEFKTPAWERVWQFINTIMIGGIAVLMFLTWQRQQQPPVPVRWDVNAFEFTKPFPTDEDSGIKYEVMLRFYDFDYSHGIGVKNGEAEQEVSADGILDRIGNDGWELAWSDGKNYIVKRPQGKWYHDSFEVFEQIWTNALGTKS